ncbi:hypothetical protein [Gordonia sp. NPDC127522]|uniref:hypothetical protein n=1 Tax=Gordonia sp. NPDC127522 TaxID=3345390 RepID=UPI003631A4C5
MVAPHREHRTNLIGIEDTQQEDAEGWNEAFASRSIESLRNWFSNNCRPRVPPYRRALFGQHVVQSQEAADALIGKVIIGSVRVTGDGIELRDFWLFSRDTEWAIDIGAGLHTHLHHVYIDGQGQWINSHGFGSSEGSFTRLHAHHVQVQGMSDGARLCAESLYEYIYIHNPISFNKSRAGEMWDGRNGVHPHSDGFQMTSGYNTKLRRSFIEMLPKFGPNIVSCVLLQTPSNPISNITIEENYCTGGGKTFHVYDSGHGAPKKIKFRNNLIGTGWSSSGGGIWGLDAPSLTERIGNRYAHSGMPVPLTVGPLTKPQSRSELHLGPGQ